MERKRKLPARAARVESVSKKRTSTPPEPRTQRTPPPPPTPVVEEALPKNISAGKPLPTLNGPQPENLSSKAFQSISESGVLADSLQRSRQKWLSEGIFERYWTKPTKKKSVAELANNPAKDTMTKLGTCTITVEPHIFEAQMFAIKDSNTKLAPLHTTQQRMYRPIIQYGPPNGMMPPPPPPSDPAPLHVQQKPFPPPQPPQQVSPRPKDTPMATSASISPGNNTHPPGSRPPSNSSIPNGLPSPGMSPIAQQPTLPPKNAPPSAAANKSTDPVIQMLAERAATDPDLKALMRIVANGEASPEELKKFQTHIDDLTRLQKSRQAAAQVTPQSQSHNQHPPTAAVVEVNGYANTQPAPSPNQGPGLTSRTTPALPSPARPQPQFQPQPQALRSKGPLSAAKSDISGVVFEFTGGSGDRFLFPKFSILEYLPQGQVIASFLIVRKGSSSDSPKYDPELDYYQPITIRLYAHQGRQLEALQKIVAPPDEVRRYMDDIMDNMTRAEYVLLAMRLPKDTEISQPEKEDGVEKTDRVDNQLLWATTNPRPVPKAKPIEKVLTEEEQYQSFIATVS